MGELSQEDLEELLQYEAFENGQPAPTEAEMAQMCAAAMGPAKAEDALAQARQSVEEWEQRSNAPGAQGSQQAAGGQNTMSGANIQ